MVFARKKRKKLVFERFFGFFGVLTAQFRFAIHYEVAQKISAYLFAIDLFLKKEEVWFLVLFSVFRRFSCIQRTNIV
jgi:hypothetical protein